MSLFLFKVYILTAIHNFTHIYTIDTCLGMYSILNQFYCIQFMKWMMSYYRKESGSTLVLCLVLELFLECYCVIARSTKPDNLRTNVHIWGTLHGTDPRFANWILRRIYISCSRRHWAPRWAVAHDSIPRLSSASAVCSSLKLYTLHIHKNCPESGRGTGC